MLSLAWDLTVVVFKSRSAAVRYGSVQDYGPSPAGTLDTDQAVRLFVNTAEKSYGAPTFLNQLPEVVEQVEIGRSEGRGMDGSAERGHK